MRKTVWLCLCGLVFLLTGSVAAQDTPSLWEQVKPVAQFGYGSLLSVYWSPLTEQLAAAGDGGAMVGGGGGCAGGVMTTKEAAAP